MPSPVLIIHDYALYNSENCWQRQHLVYVDPIDQVREIKKLLERVKAKDIHWVHYCLDTDEMNEQSEDSENDSECDSCGRSCDCNKKEPCRKWTRDEHEERIAELISEKSLETPKEWFDLLKDVSDGILDDDVEFEWGVLVHAGEQQKSE
jgi:hypothetical protein